MVSLTYKIFIKIFIIVTSAQWHRTSLCSVIILILHTNCTFLWLLNLHSNSIPSLKCSFYVNAFKYSVTNVFILYPWQHQKTIVVFRVYKMGALTRNGLNRSNFARKEHVVLVVSRVVKNDFIFTWSPLQASTGKFSQMFRISFIPIGRQCNRWFRTFFI